MSEGRSQPLIVDWDLSVPDGAPFWDLINYTVTDYFSRGQSWPSAFEGAIRDILGRRGADFPDGGRYDLLKTSDLYVAALTYRSDVFNKS